MFSNEYIPALQMIDSEKLYNIKVIIMKLIKRIKWIKAKKKQD